MQNFRAIQALRIEGLQRVNLFVGSNGCGKTSLLEAMWLNARSFGVPEVRNVALAHDMGTSPAGSQHILYLPNEFMHKSGALGDLLSISLGNREFSVNWSHREEPWLSKFITEQVSRLQPDVYSRIHSSVVIIKSSAAAHTPQEMINRTLEWLGADPAIAVPYTLYDPDLLAPVPTAFLPSINGLDGFAAQRWNNAVLEGKEELVEDALRCVIPEIRRVNFVSKRAGSQTLQVPVASMRDNTVLPIRALGDGVTRAFNLALAIASVADGCFFVDEFETGLHHSVQQKLFHHVVSLADRYNVQCFFSTHSRDTIEAAENAGQGAHTLKLYRLERLADGTHHAVPFTGSELHQVAAEAIEIR